MCGVSQYLHLQKYCVSKNFSKNKFHRFIILILNLCYEGLRNLKVKTCKMVTISCFFLLIVSYKKSRGGERCDHMSEGKEAFFLG